jgi:CTP:molybdopterin cytidylyltransferase MocA
MSDGPPATFDGAASRAASYDWDVPTAGAPVAIVLAAGKSERMGRDKLIEVLDGVPLIERTLATFLRSKSVPDVVLVVSQGGQERFAWLKSVKVHLVVNPDPDRGMITSIRKGLESTWSHERDFFVHPADVPYVKPETVDRIARERTTRGAKIVVPAYQGLGGHPGLFAASLRDEFFRPGDAAGTREILRRHREDTVRLNLPDPDVCFDVDTPEDVKAAPDPGARWARVEQKVQEKRTGRTDTGSRR